MANLKRAHEELFRRPPDERFDSLATLIERCRQTRRNSQERWHAPETLLPSIDAGRVQVQVGDDGAFALNHWSFSQLCTMCGVNRDTINVLSPETATRALQETRPRGSKPMQFLTDDGTVRAMHGTQYSRLWNVDLLTAVQEAAPDFQPPQLAVGGGTGLYCGEQDMFAFLVDPAGWVEMDGNAFAPGFFLWNSEVGRRSLGVETFWWQAVCGNHIVWDAVEVVEFSRKHTGNVGDSLTEIRHIIDRLVAKRDARKDEFAVVVAKAMKQSVGDSEEASKFLAKQGIGRGLVKKAVAMIGEEGKPFTIWTLVDALTRLSQQAAYVGLRTETDAKASRLLALAV